MLSPASASEDKEISSRQDDRFFLKRNMSSIIFGDADLSECQDADNLASKIVGKVRNEVEIGHNLNSANSSFSSYLNLNKRLLAKQSNLVIEMKLQAELISHSKFPTMPYIKKNGYLPNLPERSGITVERIQHLSPDVLEQKSLRYLEFKQRNQQALLEEYTPNGLRYNEHLPFYEIAAQPFRVLEAPGLQENIHTNVLDWTALNLVILSLGSKVFSWDPISKKTTELLTLKGNQITSVRADTSGRILAVGDSAGHLTLIDLNKPHKLNTHCLGKERLGCIAWSQVSDIMLAGSKNSVIYAIDHRVDADFFAELMGHSSELLNIAFEPNKNNFASSCDQGTVRVWDLKKSRPYCSPPGHSSAVKALNWNGKKSGLLMSGSSEEDCKIQCWNTISGTEEAKVSTESGVLGLVSSPHHNLVVSSHAAPNRSLSVWRVSRESELVKIANLQGHDSACVYMCLGPEGEDILTGAADNCLKFWKVFLPADSGSRVHPAKQHADLWPAQPSVPFKTPLFPPFSPSLR